MLGAVGARRVAEVVGVDGMMWREHVDRAVGCGIIVIRRGKRGVRGLCRFGIG